MDNERFCPVHQTSRVKSLTPRRAGEHARIYEQNRALGVAYLMLPRFFVLSMASFFTLFPRVSTRHATALRALPIQAEI
jgi:hypothetical protein